MSFYYWQTSDGNYIGRLNLIGWPADKKKAFDTWINSNTFNGISYGDGLVEFQNINDFTVFVLTWT